MNLDYINDVTGDSPAVSAADDGIAVAALSERFQETDNSYAQRQLRFHEAYVNFVERPSRRTEEEMRRALGTGYSTAREAISTSDMPLLFADTLNRELLGRWNTVQLPSFEPYVAMVRMPDLFDRTYYGLSGGSKALDPVNELGEYKERALREETAKWRIRKYGNRFAFSFEFFLRQSMDIFNRTMQELAVGARRRDYRIATELFVDANGPHASLYKSNYTGPSNFTTNIITGNPAFGPTGFELGMDLLGRMVDEDGEPIVIEMAHLVIPPALEQRANQMFGGTEWEVTMDGNTFRIPNPYRGRVRVHVNPYIPVIANVANGNTSWFLFADPGSGRPALQFGRLAGFEAPQLFIKEPNARRVGGGSDVFDGSFENDSLEHKIRMFAGGNRFEPRATVASNGSGV
jgi:hypothetical protein